MFPAFGLTDIAHVIQLAVAPVFLLTGVGALLSVLTSRLARIIDRGRTLEALMAGAAESKERKAESGIEAELVTLARRARLINRAISLATISALLVCAVIAALFFGVFFSIDVSTPVGLVFIACMLTLMGGLLAFLQEVHVAIRSLRIGPPRKRF